MLFIGGSRVGRAGARRPYGTQFFHFRIHFHQKVPVSAVHAPPTGAHLPLREILDLPLLLAQWCGI